jgi:phospholipid/cholesterol/gamma-HCH transport system substrate-binding protein
MVGAVTTLIVIVAVFLAYNANSGLPFVPVYKVSIQVPASERLVSNNEVRIGGHRVGVVESIDNVDEEDVEQVTVSNGNDTKSDGVTPQNENDTCCVYAQLNLKLDKSVEPLPVDSIFRVRYRSSFGLKYLEIVRGTGEPANEGYIFNGLNDSADCELPVDPANFQPVDTAQDGCYQQQTEFDAINDTFDKPTRNNSRTNLVGFGNGFAGRGASLNEAIGTLKPLFSNLKPVARILAAPDTQLERFIVSLARTAEQVAPVATEQAQFFTNAAIAFDALSADPDTLRRVIEESPPTLETGIRTLPAQRAFLADFAELSKRLKPGIHQLRLALPDLNDAVRIGTPVLNDSVQMNKDLKTVFVELEGIVEQPSTKISLQRLKDTFDTAKPLIDYVGPVQTVCNYWNYWFTYLTEHITERDSVGYQQRISLVQTPPGGLSVNLPIVGNVFLPGETQTPVGGYSGLQSNAKAGLLPSPADNGVFKPRELPIVHGNPYQPLGQPEFDVNGVPDCQSGQSGYVLGDYPVPGQGASNPAFAVSNIPGSQGPTTMYINQNGTRELRDTRIASHQP